jgi:hypothetical protein
MKIWASSCNWICDTKSSLKSWQLFKRSKVFYLRNLITMKEIPSLDCTMGQLRSLCISFRSNINPGFLCILFPST